MSNKDSKLKEEKDQKPKKSLKDVKGEELSDEALKKVSGGRRGEECPTGNASALKAL